jgi:hypothetical protein
MILRNESGNSGDATGIESSAEQTKPISVTTLTGLFLCRSGDDGIRTRGLGLDRAAC